MKPPLAVLWFLTAALLQSPAERADVRESGAGRAVSPLSAERAASAAPVPKRLAPPALLVRTAADRPSDALAVTRMDVRASIEGFVAETTTTLTFRNGYGRALEGELVFPLPEGATVSGYALDVNGEMIDGVVVEHHEARIAFEKELRRRVDPGLVEWAQGNNFRTRVWPIPANGTRTVRVRYVSRLVVRGSDEGREASYILPLARRERIPDLSLRIEVPHADEAPQVRSGGLERLGFTRWQDRFVAEARLRDFLPDHDLVIALPRVPDQVLALGTDEDGRVYFAMDGPVDLPAPARERARRVGLYWDASLSRVGADRERELGVLERWLRRAAPLEVDVVVFRNEPEPVRTFSIGGGEPGALLELLRQAPCDGGTALGALRFAAGHDYDLLVSDGLADLGADLPRPGAPLYALNGDSRANHALLDHLARASGGAYLNLQDTTPADAAEAIGAPVARLLSVEYDAARIADVRPAVPTALRGRLTVTGRLVAPEASLTLRYGIGGETRTRTYALRQSDAGAGRLVPRLWAEQRVAELSAFPERNHDELLGLGRRFGIVTPGASLLVFERLEQYVEHHVEPPRSRPALREAYLSRVAAAERQQAVKRGDKLERVVAMWNERVAWWQREFPRRAVGKAERSLPGRPEDDLDMGVEGGVAGGIAGGVPGGVVGGVVGRLPDAPPPPPARPGRVVAQEQRDRVAAVNAPLSAPSESKALASGAPGRDEAVAATIVLTPWDPDTPYLRALRDVPPDQAYTVFLRERREYGNSPAFYLDCADQLASLGQRALALRALTDVVELQLAEPRLLRIAAHRLQQLDHLELAVRLFEEVLRLRPEEPQSPRDLALALAARAEERLRREGSAAEAARDFQRALELLNRIVTTEWDGRFPQIEVIALEEASRIAAIVARHPGLRSAVDNPIDLRLRQPLTMDLRVVLTWDADLTDMDLWVVEPSGERCYYRHALTSVGGAITQDFTQGYGPEVYAIRRAPTGRYKVKTNFYGSGAQSLTGPTTVQATVITDFGRPNERRRALTVRLASRQDVVDVGEVTVEAAQAPPVTKGPGRPVGR